MTPPPTPWRSSPSVFTFAWLSKKPHSWSQGKDIVGRVWGGWELENPGRNETNWWEGDRIFFLKEKKSQKKKRQKERLQAASSINQMILIPAPLSLSLSFCIGFPEHSIQRLASLPHSLHPSSAKSHPSASTPSKNSLRKSSLQVQTLGALTDNKNC